MLKFSEISSSRRIYIVDIFIVVKLQKLKLKGFSNSCQNESTSSSNKRYVTIFQVHAHPAIVHCGNA